MNSSENGLVYTVLRLAMTYSVYIQMYRAQLFKTNGVVNVWLKFQTLISDIGQYFC